VHAVAQVRSWEAGIAVGNDDGRVGRVEACGPGGDPIVKGSDRGGRADAERDNKIDLGERIR